ncbi:MAG: hypothetical protein R2712_12320 [Vicinamibacterales bacterium]
MARHYIKVPEFVRDYFPGGAPANWREAIVADATDDGTRLTVEPLPANDRGPRIAVHGDRFYYWFGRDAFRSDTLFVMRMELARTPRQQPTHHFAQFERWPGGNPAGADSVDGLFGITPQTEVEEESGVDELPLTEPTPLLISRLGETPALPLDRFRPVTQAALPTDVENAIEAFRWCWRRYRLASRVPVPPRLESVLRGGVTPTTLDIAEWRELSLAFGVAALNALVLDEPTPERLHRAIEDLGDLPLEASARVGVWLALMRGLSGHELRRELHENAPQLLRAVDGGLEGEVSWKKASCRCGRPQSATPTASCRKWSRRPRSRRIPWCMWHGGLPLSSSRR